MSNLVESSIFRAPLSDDGGLRTAASIEPLHARYVRCRDLIERIIAMVLLISVLPLIAVLALLVRSGSHGGAFYLQKRRGQHGKEYSMFKLRSMRSDSEVLTGPIWAAKEDQRVTPLGQFLRETHLDELPQLWNVVKGEMSLIGPRPERSVIAARIEEVNPNYRHRVRLRPGLTGLAQVMLPADRDVADAFRKLDFDIYYIREVSLRLDLRIALATVFHMIELFFSSLGRRMVRSHRLSVESNSLAFVEDEADEMEVASPI